MNKSAKLALKIAKEIHNNIPHRFVPPSEGSFPQSQMVLPHALVKGTRGYIEKVVKQINGCYEKGWYDACAVMMRRLCETMIIECFETYNISYKIKDRNGNFLNLNALISIMLKETSWNLGRNTKKALPKLKNLGDQSAHSRRFNAYREDIDKQLDNFRLVIQELLYLSKLK
ncbi:MAG: hypothetical protein ACTSYD_04195 [Candidatus Heimdallarchaeaceae archaeon]